MRRGSGRIAFEARKTKLKSPEIFLYQPLITHSLSPPLKPRTQQSVLNLAENGRQLLAMVPIATQQRADVKNKLTAALEQGRG